MRTKQVLSAVGVLALAGSVYGQSGSLSLTTASTWDSLSTSITLQVWADADVGTHVVGAAFSLGSLFADENIEDVSLLSVAGWGGLGEDDFGYDGVGGHSGVVMGQATFLPFIQPDAASALGDGPVLIATLQVDFVTNLFGTTNSFYRWDLGELDGADFALEVIDVDANPGGTPPGELIRISDLTLGNVKIHVPAPGAGFVLGLGGLVCVRRRR